MGAWKQNQTKFTWGTMAENHFRPTCRQRRISLSHWLSARYILLWRNGRGSSRTF